MWLNLIRDISLIQLGQTKREQTYNESGNT